MEDKNSGKILKEMKDLNKTMNSIKTFIIAETQLLKTIALETKNNTREIKEIKKLMEVKNG